MIYCKNVVKNVVDVAPLIIFFFGWFSAHCSMISIQATINKEEKFINDFFNKGIGLEYIYF